MRIAGDNCKDTNKVADNIDTSKRGLVKKLFVGLMALPFLGLITKKAEADWGSCKMCSCRKFEGWNSDYPCKNCGHMYYAHL